MQLCMLYTDKSLIWQVDIVLIQAGSLIQAGVRGSKQPETSIRSFTVMDMPNLHISYLIL